MTTPRRKFTDSFGLGDIVTITRTRHGWFDGMIGGPIIEISDYACKVRVEDDETYGGSEFDIEHVRDISLSSRAKVSNKKKRRK
jgi:hypothetical protein